MLNLSIFFRPCGRGIFLGFVLSWLISSFAVGAFDEAMTSVDPPDASSSELSSDTHKPSLTPPQPAEQLIIRHQSSLGLPAELLTFMQEKNISHRVF